MASIEYVADAASLLVGGGGIGGIFVMTAMESRVDAVRRVLGSLGGDPRVLSGLYIRLMGDETEDVTLRKVAYSLQLLLDMSSYEKNEQQGVRLSAAQCAYTQETRQRYEARLCEQEGAVDHKQLYKSMKDNLLVHLYAEYIDVQAIGRKGKTWVTAMNAELRQSYLTYDVDKPTRLGGQPDLSMRLYPANMMYFYIPGSRTKQVHVKSSLVEAEPLETDAQMYRIINAAGLDCLMKLRYEGSARPEEAATRAMIWGFAREVQRYTKDMSGVPESISDREVLKQRLCVLYRLSQGVREKLDQSKPVNNMRQL